MTDEGKKVIDLLKNIDKQKCMMLECPVVKNNIERQLKIIELNRIIRKQSKEIEEMKKQLDLDNECEIALNSKVMDLEKEIEELKDKNKSIVYNYEMVVDKLENSTPNDKIKAKIEEIDIEIQCCEYADDDTEEYKQNIEKEKRRLLRDKAVLQSLLEKE